MIINDGALKQEHAWAQLLFLLNRNHREPKLRRSKHRVPHNCAPPEHSNAWVRMKSFFVAAKRFLSKQIDFAEERGASATVGRGA